MTTTVPIPNHIPPHHRAKLSWFANHAGQSTGWPINMPDGSLLAMKAKGIYKPADSIYALSVKQSIGGPYADRDPVHNDDGSWTYLYYQEEQAGKEPEALHTNRAMRLCMRDEVPIGVLRQLSPKPNVKYQILGLARIIGKVAGYYLLEGVDLQQSQMTERIRYDAFLHPKVESKSEVPSVGEVLMDLRIHRLKTVVQRQGQARFREELLEVYERKCAISSCDVEDVLEACHVLPYMGQHTNTAANGIILRSDFHILFDEGLIAVDPSSNKIEFSPSLRNNGHYAEYHGRTLHPGAKKIEPDYLIAHRHYCGF